MVMRVLTLWLVIAVGSTGLVAGAAGQGLQQMAERFNRMGRDALNNRNWADCIENFTQVVEIDSEYLDAYMDLAYCQEKMQQYKDAVDTYREAIKLAPDDRRSEILNLMGFAQATSGQLDAAVATYTQLVAIDPHNKDVFVGLAHTLVNLDRPAEAIVAYEKALELDPHDVDLMRTLGDLCEKNKLPEQAIAVYERWLEVEPDNVEPLRLLAYALRSIQACEKGFAAFDRLLAVDDSNPGDLLALGNLYQKCGQPGKAIPIYDEYAALRPDDPTVDCLRLSLYEDTKQYGEGVRTGKQLTQKHPHEPCVIFSYGRLLDKYGSKTLVDAKKYEDAIAVFKQATAVFQKVLGDPTYGGPAEKQIKRLEQLVTRTRRLQQQEEQGY